MTGASDVQILREAAARMRALAEAAVVEAWAPVAAGDEYLHQGDVTTVGIPGERYIVCEHAGDTAPHIAAWDPTVSLAVARWLDAESNEPGTDLGDGISIGGPSLDALAVARAFLGTTP